MPNPWTESLTDRPALNEDSYTPARGRNPDSSVAAQYEDSVPPDTTDFPDDEEHEAS